MADFFLDLDENFTPIYMQYKALHFRGIKTNINSLKSNFFSKQPSVCSFSFPLMGFRNKIRNYLCDVISRQLIAPLKHYREMEDEQV